MSTTIPSDFPSDHTPRPGIFPLSGRFSDELWATVFAREAKTIQRWVKQYKVPHKIAGSTMIIDASDFWAALPYGGGEEVTEE